MFLSFFSLSGSGRVSQLTAVSDEWGFDRKRQQQQQSEREREGKKEERNQPSIFLIFMFAFRFSFCRFGLVLLCERLVIEALNRDTC